MHNEDIESINLCGKGFIQTLHEIGGTDPVGERQDSRELALAQTKIEEAVMWAVKHLTK